MTQAPATTVANAVRQHGGGRTPMHLQRTAPDGRLMHSRGGVINRRGEAATSSNPPFASCAAATHPTTGVRRARKSSPSLRSQNCPHAQLVKGYKAATLLEVQFRQLHLRRTPNTSYCPETYTNYLFHQASLLIAECRITYELPQRSQGSLDAASQLNPADSRLRARYRAVSDLRHKRQVVLQADFQLLQFKGVSVIPYCLVGSTENIAGMGGECHDLLHEFRFAVRSFMTASSILKAGHENSHSNRRNRSNSLHPGRSMLTTPRQGHQPPSRQQHQRREQQRLAYLSQSEAYVELPIEHANLPALVLAASLPAPCHHVQRGAA